MTQSSRRSSEPRRFSKALPGDDCLRRPSLLRLHAHKGMR
ncbi:hypothetical protein DEDE109153_03955 [Deinococcus deserti]